MKTKFLIFIMICILPVCSAASERVTPLVKAVAKAADAMVNISIQSGSKSRASYEGLGAGFIVRSDGYIATSYHVVEGASTIQVSLSDGSKYSAQLAGFDKALDIAVLKIAAPRQLPYLKLASSADVYLGETVVAMGNPLGFDNSIATGIIANKRRTMLSNKGFVSYIQIDATLNHGNSGGPLINLDGEVVGINNVIYREYDAVGISFATPSDVLSRVIPELIQNRSMRKSSAGFNMQQRGTLFTVTAVTPGGAAALEGVRAGDDLLYLDGLKVDGRDVIDYVMQTFTPGSILNAVFSRGGKEYTAAMRLN